MDPDQAFGETTPDIARGAVNAAPGVHPRSPVPAGLAGVRALAVGQAALILFTVTALTAVAGHRRGGGKRGATHARTSRPPAGPARPANTGDPFILGGPELPREPEPAEPVDDYPSWPGRPGPYALHPDHPSWPGQPDARWNAEVAALREDDFARWPGSPAASRPDVQPPAQAAGQPGGPGGRRSARREAPYPPRDNPPRPPAGGRPDRSATGPRPYPPAVDTGPRAPGQSGRRRADAGPRAGFAPHPESAPYAGTASHSGTAPYAGFAPGAGFAAAPVHSDGAQGVIERVRPEASQVRPEVRRVQPENGQVWDAGSVQLATWIISEANQQATEIRHEARDHAAASLAGAKQEAAELMRQAAERAAATLATAEREAAEARAEVTKLSAHLGGVASYVAENLGVRALAPGRSVDQLMIGAPLAEPVAASAAATVAEPAAAVAEPAVKPKAVPRERSAARPGTARPGAARPAAGRAAGGRAAAAKPASSGAVAAKSARVAGAAANPNAVPRQILAGRVMGIIVLALFMFALLAGTSEVALHGFRFFVFRSVGTGETSGNGLQENQGPGQPDAPGAHR